MLRLSCVCPAGLLALVWGSFAKTPPKPHILFVMQDDLGHHDIGYNNEVMEPVSWNISALARSGIVLTNHLVHFHCSPTRRSFISGRLPLHHGEGLSEVASDDIDLRWTLVSGKLKSAGYKTHWVGKGHTGYKSVAHLPTNRGFDSFQGFLSGSQDYYSDDRWEDGAPFSNNTNYSTALFGETAIDIILKHDATVPFFMYLAWQAVHSPYSPVPDWNGNTKAYAPYTGVYAGMIYDADVYTGRVVEALKTKGMWNKVLMVYSSDNGGVSWNQLQGNNYPLRGEKHSNWRGGYRVAAFVSGGFIPSTLAGSTSNLRIHVVDWYPTFCELAGVDASDGSDIPPLPIDPSNPSKDIWGNHSWPDVDGTSVWSSLTSGSEDFVVHPTLWVSGQVLLRDSMKLLVGQGFVGDSGEKTPGKDGWRYPNGSWIDPPPDWKCGLTYKAGSRYIPCLFNESDIREMTNLAGVNSDHVTSMWEELNRTNLGSFSSRSPASMLGPCNAQCATAYWKSKGSKSGIGPICGVPGCGSGPSPSPSPPSPKQRGPFEPLPHATNCSVRTGFGSKDRTGERYDAANPTACCENCFRSSFCVLASFVNESCFFHRTVKDIIAVEKVDLIVTGRIPLH